MIDIYSGSALRAQPRDKQLQAGSETLQFDRHKPTMPVLILLTVLVGKFISHFRGLHGVFGAEHGAALSKFLNRVRKGLTLQRF